MSLAQQIARANRDLRKSMDGIGGGGSPEMRAAGKVLLKAIRKQLNKKAAPIQGPLRPGAKQKFASSAPGEAPRRRLGKLAKSAGMQVEGATLRVGVARFVGRLLESGVDADARTERKRDTVIETSGRRKGKTKTIRHKQGRKKLHIAARPFMEKALAEAQPQMEGEFVAVLKKRTGGG